MELTAAISKLEEQRLRSRAIFIGRLSECGVAEFACVQKLRAS